MLREQICIIAALTLILAAVGAIHWSNARREAAAPPRAALRVHPTPPGTADSPVPQ